MPHTGGSFVIKPLVIKPDPKPRVREKLVDCASMLTYAGVCIRQRTSAYVSVRQHTGKLLDGARKPALSNAIVSIRQHTPAYASIRQHTPAFASIRQHTPAYVSIRQHTPAYAVIQLSQTQ